MFLFDGAFCTFGSVLTIPKERTYEPKPIYLQRRPKIDRLAPPSQEKAQGEAETRKVEVRLLWPLRLVKHPSSRRAPGHLGRVFLFQQ